MSARPGFRRHAKAGEIERVLADRPRRHDEPSPGLCQISGRHWHEFRGTHADVSHLQGNLDTPDDREIPMPPIASLRKPVTP